MYINPFTWVWRAAPSPSSRPYLATSRCKSRPSGGTPAALPTAIPALEAQEGEIAAGILRPSGGM